MTIPSRSIRLIPKPASELTRFAENSGEIFYDKTSNTLKLFDGRKNGGYALLRADLSNLETTGGTNVNFGEKTLVAQGFQGNLTGNVTGQVSDISNHTLDELSNVIVASANPGQLLGFNGTNWVPISLSGTFNGGEITGALNIRNNTASTSSTTGALIVLGGAGIGGALSVGGVLRGTTINITNNFTATGSVTAAGVSSSANVTVTNHGTVKLYDADGSNFVALRAPSIVSSDITFTLPATYGTAGQVLQTNGAGATSWVTVSGGGGGGSGVTNLPGGSVGSIQFNNGDAFGGVETFFYDSTLDKVTIANLYVTTSLSAGSITSSGTISGSISSNNATITGGSISNASGSFTSLSASDSVTLTKNTNSTSTTTGAVVVAGGLGVGQNVNVGGTVSVNNTITATGSITSNTNIAANNNVTVGNNVTVNNDVTVGQNVIISKLPSSASHATNRQYVDTRSLAMAIAMS